MFAAAISDPKTREEVNPTGQPYQIFKGIEDHPLGKMKGIAGEICFLSDLLGNLNDAKFPAYEL